MTATIFVLVVCNRDVRGEQCYCLRYDTLRKKSCVSSPPIPVLNGMALEAITLMCANPDPNMSEANRAEYNRWTKLLGYMTKYEANAGKKR